MGAGRGGGSFCLGNAATVGVHRYHAQNSIDHQRRPHTGARSRTTTSGPRRDTHPHAIAAWRLLGQYFVAGAFGNADILALLPTQFLIAGAFGSADPHAPRLARFFIASAFRTADQRAVWPAPFLIAGARGTTDPLAPKPAQLIVAGAFGNADPLTRQPALNCFAGALASFVAKLAIECWDHGRWTLAVLAALPPLAVLHDRQGYAQLETVALVQFHTFRACICAYRKQVAVSRNIRAHAWCA
jgi:hypothetical protein